ncbi:MAG: hypothetical protein DRP35_07780, partial [Candidatus Zixiibacteriota bacterium]
MKKYIILLLTVGIFQMAHAQTLTLNSFLDIKLGTKLSDFLNKNAEAREDSVFNLRGTAMINTKNMIV